MSYISYLRIKYILPTRQLCSRHFNFFTDVWIWRVFNFKRKEKEKMVMINNGFGKEKFILSNAGVKVHNIHLLFSMTYYVHFPIYPPLPSYIYFKIPTMQCILFKFSAF